MPNNLKKYSFFLVRHGESIWNYEQKFIGWTNVPLTKRGEHQSKAVFKTLKNNNLKPNIIYTSALKRAFDTSIIIKDNINDKIDDKIDDTKNIKIVQNWRLNEKYYGSLEGITHDDFEKQYSTDLLNKVKYSFDYFPPAIRNIFYEQNYQNLINKPNVAFNQNPFDNKSIYEDTIDEYKLMKYSPYTNYYLKKIISNGESSRQVFDRALFYFNHAIFPGMKQGEIPLIVTHKHTARVLLKHFLNITNDEIFEKYDFQRSELLQLIMDENKQVINTLSFKIEE